MTLRSYGKDEILIQVHVAGSNPKDWKHPMPNYFNVKLNQGDDCAGIVAEVGSDVKSFKPGDRVAGFHQMDTPRGTYAEYTVCPEHTVFHIPESMSFEEAATIPLTG
jgi:NADPH:quinone reductase